MGAALLRNALPQLLLSQTKLAERTVKRPADQGQCGPSKKARSETWPTVFTGNEVVWQNPSKPWMTDVKEVVLGGERRCEFSMETCTLVRVTLETLTQSVELEDIPLSTTKSSQRYFAFRAHRLTSACRRLCETTCHTIKQFPRPASTAVSDADDEQVPDPELPPASSEPELGVLNFLYHALWLAFGEARRKKFQKAVGKDFFTEFGKFLLQVHSEDTMWRYKSTHSTKPSGEAQPGSLTMTHTTLRRELRTPSLQERTQAHQKRVADYVLFDKDKSMYCIVGELKSDEDEAESQNIEQMVGLFRKDQAGMLGFTCNPQAVLPRVLRQVEGTLKLYTLPSLSLNDACCSESLRKLAKLFIAFTSIVNIAL